MNKPNTTCRVCGKEYYCCQDSKNINGWRTMACSPECFKEYMRRIEEARTPKPTITVNDNKVESSKMKYNKKKVVDEVDENKTEEKVIED